MRILIPFLTLAVLICILSCDKKTTEPKYPCAIPVFSPEGGTFTEAQRVSITCATSEATIRYTTNGSDPTSSSTLYSNPINIASTTTIKAKAFKSGWTDSTITSAIYTIIQTVVTPTFNPPGNTTYASAQNVTISCTTAGAAIRYTTNGSDPTSLSTLYSNPINIASTTTIKAKAIKSGWTDSAIAAGIFAIGTMPGQMILVPGGTFTMGDIYGGGDSNELPTHRVTVSFFYMDKYELKQTAYQAVMGVNPSHFTGVTNGPVEQVSWFNAIEYCNRRSINEGITPCYSYSTYGTNPATWPTGWNTDYNNHTNVSCSWTANGYRLPTEAEWEFAARGGNSTHGYVYSGSNDINRVAWYGNNAGLRTHAVGTKSANELGLFDMSGNIIEWVWDIYGSYSIDEQNNPHGAVSGWSAHLDRGGGWNADPNLCTVSSRSVYNSATLSYDYLGFRVCRVSPGTVISRRKMSPD